MKERNRTLDIAKGIGIILVVIGHGYSGDSIISHLINGFHMPLFFILSGIIYATKEKVAFNLTKKIRLFRHHCG